MNRRSFLGGLAAIATGILFRQPAAATPPTNSQVLRPSATDFKIPETHTTSFTMPTQIIYAEDGSFQRFGRRFEFDALGNLIKVGPELPF